MDTENTNFHTARAKTRHPRRGIVTILYQNAVGKGALIEGLQVAE